jgi:transposase-like protein
VVSFSGRHYPKFIILQCVRWYVSYALSYRNIEEMMVERGFEMDHRHIKRITNPMGALGKCIPHRGR